MNSAIRTALISVSDKTGIVELARGLAALGVRLLSTGGTARLLQEHGLPVEEVASYTGAPEILDGRVKTLHPRIHGGLLGRLDLESHRQQMAEQGIQPIGLLVLNLYPFEETVAARPGRDGLAEAIENIDIGGPAMLRAAAKNWRHVGVVTEPAQYGPVLEELQRGGALSEKTRFALCVAAFGRVARYDQAIAAYLGGLDGFPPPRWFSAYALAQPLRYGENPHQQAALYREEPPAAGTLATYTQIQGKELSYNNIADADVAWECAREFAELACVIVKHANPCGVALGRGCAEAYERAFQTDPTSAFGGIIAFNRMLDAHAARALSRQFVEVLIAPDYTPEALEVLAAKGNLRVLKIPAGFAAAEVYQQKQVGGGMLIQSPDQHVLRDADLKVVTERAPDAAQLRDLRFAWQVAKFVKSNAIVYARDGMTLGVGAGQMSRVDAARIARLKAEGAGLQLAGACVASDAFFPFRDGLDVLADAGAQAVIQPGGSVRDAEVIAAANERGVAMVFTGIRHFRH